MDEYLLWMRTCGCMYSALIHIYTQRNGKNGQGTKELAHRSVAYFENPRISNYLSLKCDQIVGK